MMHSLLRVEFTYGKCSDENGRFLFRETGHFRGVPPNSKLHTPATQTQIKNLSTRLRKGAKVGLHCGPAAGEQRFGLIVGNR